LRKRPEKAMARQTRAFRLSRSSGRVLGKYDQN
jgi:hypothetical protein